MIRITTRRPAGSTAEGAARDGLADRRAAAAVLARALWDLARPGGAPDPTDDRPAEAWEDDDYLYIEVRLPGDLGTDIDVSTSGRTLMVRIARGG